MTQTPRAEVYTQHLHGGYIQPTVLPRVRGENGQLDERSMLMDAQAGLINWGKGSAQLKGVISKVVPCGTTPIGAPNQ